MTCLSPATRNEEVDDFMGKNHPDVDDRCFDGHPRGFCRFFIFGAILFVSSFERKKAIQMTLPSTLSGVQPEQKKVEWHIIKLQILIAPNVVSDELLVFSNFYTTNYPSTTNCFFVTTVSPINWSLFFRVERQGWCIGPRYKGFQQSDGRIFHTIKTMYFRNVLHSRKLMAETYKKMQVWKMICHFFFDDFVFREKFQTNSVPFPWIFWTAPKLGRPFDRTPGCVFPGTRNAYVGETQGVWALGL